MLYNVNLFLQIESDFLKFFIFIWFQKYEPAFFYYCEKHLFYNIVVDSVNMDMLGFGSLSIEVRVLCIVESIGLQHRVTMEANAFPSD